MGTGQHFPAGSRPAKISLAGSRPAKNLLAGSRPAAGKMFVWPAGRGRLAAGQPALPAAGAHLYSVAQEYLDLEQIATTLASFRPVNKKRSEKRQVAGRN